MNATNQVAGRPGVAPGSYAALLSDADYAAWKAQWASAMRAADAEDQRQVKAAEMADSNNDACKWEEA